MQAAEFDIITFDCYGTLIDWEAGITGALQAEAARAGQYLEAEAIISAYHMEEPAVEGQSYSPYREVLAQTARRVAARLEWELSPERAGFLAESLPRWLPFEDTNPALERLARKFELGFLSNIDDDLLAITRTHFPVSFKLIVTAENVKSYKPAPGHFEEGARQTRGRRWVHAAQSYFHDVVPARARGIPVAWINRKGEGVRPGGLSPDYEVRNLLELADLLEA